MTEIARRVIQVQPGQVIGPPRKKRRPRTDPRLISDAHDPVNWASWCGSEGWQSPPNDPVQKGFGHFDDIARGMKP